MLEAQADVTLKRLRLLGQVRQVQECQPAGEC